MAIYIYRSIDAGAPQISGTAGTLIPVLDGCLVTGYGSKSPVGQTKAFSGTNVAAYRMPASTSQTYMAIDDTGSQGARVRGFTSMPGAWSSLLGFGIAGTGGNYGHPFPQDVQISGGAYIYKSNAASAATRPWVLISNGRIIYLWIDVVGDQVQPRTFVFGDIESYNPIDSNPCILIANSTANYYNYFADIKQPNSNMNDHQMCQRYDGMQFSAPCGKTAILAASGVLQGELAIGYTSYAIQYPDMAGGGLIMSPIVVYEAYANGFNVIRGRLPGIWEPCHASSFKTGDLITGGAGTSISGRTFEAFSTYQSQSGWSGVYFMETSDTWNDINFR